MTDKMFPTSIWWFLECALTGTITKDVQTCALIPPREVNHKYQYNQETEYNNSTWPATIPFFLHALN